MGKNWMILDDEKEKEKEERRKEGRLTMFGFNLSLFVKIPSILFIFQK